MLHRVRKDFPFVSSVEVSLTKNNPPFGGNPAKAQVKLSWADPK